MIRVIQKDFQVISKLRIQTTYCKFLTCHFQCLHFNSVLACCALSSFNKTSKVDAQVVPKIKTDLKYDDSMKSEKFITPLRALYEYMLTPKDLESIPRYFSRSPYSNEVETQVFRKSDVTRVALQKHGGKEAFDLQRKLMKDMNRRAKNDRFNLNKALKLFKYQTSSLEDKVHNKSLLTTSSGKVIMFAIVVNSLNVLAKSIVWWYTGSKSMFSEMMHSVADTLNQIILAYGLQSSLQKPDAEHPYGYFRMQNISSLISGVAIFFVGSGFTFCHSIQGLVEPHQIGSTLSALTVLAGSLLSEGCTLWYAFREARKKATQLEYDSLREYMLSGCAEAGTMVVLLEDTAAVLGVVVATVALATSAITGTSWPDAIGGVCISAILALVATFIIRTNSDLLLGKSISLDKQEEIIQLIERAKVIRGIYDIKATLMGGGECVRFKAEVDIDGRELTQRYLETLPLDNLLKEIQLISSEKQAVHFLLKHGDNIVNTLGSEINKIEATIMKEFPAVKHIDIEIN